MAVGTNGPEAGQYENIVHTIGRTCSELTAGWTIATVKEGRNGSRRGTDKEDSAGCENPVLRLRKTRAQGRVFLYLR